MPIVHNLKFNDENLTKVPLLFLHIPKTGGTTFRKILHDHYTRVISSATGAEADKEVSQSMAQGVIPEVVCGHFDFTSSLYKKLGNYSNITLLRDPVERVISQIYYLKNRPDHAYYKEIKDMPISEIFKDPYTVNRYAVKDFQIHLLSGHPSYAGSRGSELRDARQSLRNNFTFFGFTEDIEAFVLLCQDRFGWSETSIPRLNAAPEDRNEKLNLSERDLEVIKTSNRREIDFFKLAHDLYDEYYAETVDTLRREAEAESAQQTEQESKEKVIVVSTQKLTFWKRVWKFLNKDLW
jgi:hypothetical protein